MVHFRGHNTTIFIFASLLNQDHHLMERICSCRSKFFPLRVDHFCKRFITGGPGGIAQSVGHLTRKSEVLGSIPSLATYFRFSFRWIKRGSCQLLAKVCAEVLVNRLGGLSLPRKSVVRLTDRPNMTLDVYRGRKTTTQQQPHYLRKQTGKQSCNPLTKMAVTYGSVSIHLES